MPLIEQSFPLSVSGVWETLPFLLQLVGSPSMGRAVIATVQESFMTPGKDRWAGGGVRTGNFTHGRLAPGPAI